MGEALRFEIFPQFSLPMDLVLAFMGVFARFEYALKASGFSRGDENRVDPDWDKFADSIDGEFEGAGDEKFVGAVDYLLTEPPRKQVMVGEGIAWQASVLDRNAKKARQVLLMVRRVRNNLFHGAKMWSPERGGDDRDVRLVTAALVVLLACAKLNDTVARKIEYLDPRILEVVGRY
ncbi:hypothetical protein HT749_12595 [Burkholderia cepacia]|uniref:hypothetical protein n=1 Tax=Burkholderia cepacia complex TaxID=87882 RepID=UPI0005042987|nr:MULTISPECIES: hypothetical protein [Burkholderia cepacia complex]KFL51680.1 hypothetical protein JM78_25045 [Burkholderia pyrrocinia]NTX44243.1 hypothetical protein [Burkholderia cepacia]